MEAEWYYVYTRSGGCSSTAQLLEQGEDAVKARVQVDVRELAPSA